MLAPLTTLDNVFRDLLYLKLTFLKVSFIENFDVY